MTGVPKECPVGEASWVGQGGCHSQSHGNVKFVEMNETERCGNSFENGDLVGEWGEC